MGRSFEHFSPQPRDLEVVAQEPTRDLCGRAQVDYYAIGFFEQKLSGESMLRWECQPLEISTIFPPRTLVELFQANPRVFLYHSPL
jgi:hypothetical protein